MAIRIRDIEPGDLNSMCIMLISKFARTLHEIDGTVLKMSDRNVLINIAKYAQSVDDPRLRMIFQRLKLELKLQLNTALPSHGDVGALVMDNNLKARIRKRNELRAERSSYSPDQQGS